jgi:hypothetical protein
MKKIVETTGLYYVLKYSGEFSNICVGHDADHSPPSSAEVENE